MRTPLVANIGETYGHLTVVSGPHRVDHTGGYKNRGYVCRCRCGVELFVRTPHLVSGHTKSCGCWKTEHYTYRKRGMHTRGPSNPEYMLWYQMIRRCHNPKAPNFSNYGGRGIKVCDRWQGESGFDNFIMDVGQRPPNPPGWTGRMPYWTIDRVDNDGHYELGNVRWATQAEQNANRRPMSTYAGKPIDRDRK